MFFLLSSATVAPRTGSLENSNPLKKTHYAALGADIILGVALSVIGILAIQYGFFPMLSNNMQYAMVGAGSTYMLVMLSLICFTIKSIKAPESYLFE